jgi:uncharacterized protein (DUF2225 family)
VTSHKETIVCPQCEAVEVATVEHYFPWYAYVHHCSKCGYIIMESEWERVPSNVTGDRQERAENENVN